MFRLPDIVHNYSDYCSEINGGSRLAEDGIFVRSSKDVNSFYDSVLSSRDWILWLTVSNGGFLLSVYSCFTASSWKSYSGFNFSLCVYVGILIFLDGSLGSFQWVTLCYLSANFVISHLLHISLIDCIFFQQPI